VILRVAKPEALDYEARDGFNRFVFKVNARNVNGGQILSSSQVEVIVKDANDNPPTFNDPNYVFNIPEDAPPGSQIGSIRASDLDSGKFGQLKYSIRGFGADRFVVDAATGEISVNSCGENVAKCLDFESREEYSLTFSAEDGGGRVSATGLTVKVEDVNDNFPVFENVLVRRPGRPSPEGDAGYLRVVIWKN